jgi:hypothetical protein
MKIKKVFRWDREEKVYRIFRIMWDNPKNSNKLSFALSPVLFRFSKGFYEWRIYILGIRIHRAKSFGGRFV